MFSTIIHYMINRNRSRNWKQSVCLQNCQLLKPPKVEWKLLDVIHWFQQTDLLQENWNQNTNIISDLITNLPCCTRPLNPKKGSKMHTRNWFSAQVLWIIKISWPPSQNLETPMTSLQNFSCSKKASFL